MAREELRLAANGCRKLNIELTPSNVRWGKNFVMMMNNDVVPA